MSLVFSSPSDQSGIIERLDEKLGTDSTSYPIDVKTSDINAALDAFKLLEIEAGGRWTPDDTNFAKLPIIELDLIQGQRDYTFETDEEGAEILETFSVMVADQNGIYRKLRPLDPKTESGTEQFYDGLDVQGVPTAYTKTGNTIIFREVPSYNRRFVEEGQCGIKLYVDRESSYFSPDDTNKKPGVPGPLHEYFVLHPAYQYASRKGLALAGGVLRNGAMTGLLRELSQFEGKIKSYLGNRARDERPRLRPRITRFK